MAFKSKFVALIMTLLLAGSSFATPNPECPDLDVMKLEGLNRSEQIFTHLFFTYHLSQYGTGFNWAFAMAPIDADSGIMALKRSNEMLDTMTTPGVSMEEANVFVCEYETGHKDVKAIAVLAELLISPGKLGKLFHIKG